MGAHRSPWGNPAVVTITIITCAVAITTTTTSIALTTIIALGGLAIMIATIVVRMIIMPMLAMLSIIVVVLVATCRMATTSTLLSIIAMRTSRGMMQPALGKRGKVPERSPLFLSEVGLLRAQLPSPPWTSPAQTSP